MNLDHVVIKEFDPGENIVYPETATKGTENRRPADLFPDDKNFNIGLPYYPGFTVHHLETLQPEIYFLRGLIEYKDKTHIFSIRVDLNNFGHKDFEKIMNMVIDKIRKGTK
jgi:hypothetical protein